ncbi:unnamed protein product [Haemonchus placei]|uniref:B30.2/SPRY domain-containing protein n=1 Tax=Haemonchus placei TaxID=6290 RepID=A0A0N4VY42_HAEPC|nr:unnamed protein product [Haemonchus placei]
MEFNGESDWRLGIADGTTKGRVDLFPWDHIGQRFCGKGKFITWIITFNESVTIFLSNHKLHIGTNSP